MTPNSMTTATREQSVLRAEKRTAGGGTSRRRAVYLIDELQPRESAESNGPCLMH